MSSKKVTKRVIALCGAAYFSLSIVVSPIASIPVQAATGSEVVQPLSDKIEWRFKIEDGRIYKRLFNYSTAEWIGEWILVGHVT